MRYQLDYIAAATRAIEKLPRIIQRRVLDRLELLTRNPPGRTHIEFASVIIESFTQSKIDA